MAESASDLGCVRLLDGTLATLTGNGWKTGDESRDGLYDELVYLGEWLDAAWCPTPGKRALERLAELTGGTVEHVVVRRAGGDKNVVY